MPIVIPKNLPAYKVLKEENIFVMNMSRAARQDIRPIEIGIVNLMPTKIETEIQLMRLLSNTPLQVNITLVNTASYKSKNIEDSHLSSFYQTFDSVKNKKFDGMIVTGAPVEKLDYCEVQYWRELTKIFDFADKNVTSTIFICWGAQAAMHYFYNIEKFPLEKKAFGIFKNRAENSFEPLLKGMDDLFSVPHSRHTVIDEKAVRSNKNLSVIASSDDGISIAKSKDNKKFFFFGHSEYDRETLKREYLRDLEKGLEIEKPLNYFVDGDINKINFSWNSTGNLLFYNWLNYYVYQVTPYQLENV